MSERRSDARAVQRAYASAWEERVRAGEVSFALLSSALLRERVPEPWSTPGSAEHEWLAGCWAHGVPPRRLPWEAARTSFSAAREVGRSFRAVYRTFREARSPEDLTPEDRGRTTALLLVDLQAAFVTGDGAVPGAAALMEAVCRLVATARSRGALVVHLQNDGPAGAADEPGTVGWQLAVGLEPGDAVVRKREDDGFAGTTLEGLLERHGVERVVLAGVQSEMCVAATARGALSRCYEVVLPHDGHGTYDVPPGPGSADPVPAALAARAAEWSLGDELVLVGSVDDVAWD